GCFDVLGDLCVVEFLAVVFGEYAAEKLDDLDADVALIGGLGIIVLTRIDRLRRIEFQRIEGRNFLLILAGNGSKTSNDACVGFRVDVLASEAPLLDGFVDEIAHSYGAARDVEL